MARTRAVHAARSGRPRAEARGAISLADSGSPWKSPRLVVEQVGQPFRLNLGRRPCQAEPEGQDDPRGVVGGGFGQNASGQGPCEFIKGVVVQECERLKRPAGLDSAGAGLSGVRGVKDHQRRVRRGAPELGVPAEAVAVGAGVGIPGPAHLAEVHQAVGLRRKDAGTADFRGQPSACRQGGVAHQFGVESEPGLAGKLAVFRVDRRQVGRSCEPWR